MVLVVFDQFVHSTRTQNSAVYQLSRGLQCSNKYRERFIKGRSCDLLQNKRASNLSALHARYPSPGSPRLVPLAIIGLRCRRFPIVEHPGRRSSLIASKLRRSSKIASVARGPSRVFGAIGASVRPSTPSARTQHFNVSSHFNSLPFHFVY